MYVCTVSYITQCNNGPRTSLNSKATNAVILYFHPQLPLPTHLWATPTPPNPFFLRILSRSTVTHPGISQIYSDSDATIHLPLSSKKCNNLNFFMGPCTSLNSNPPMLSYFVSTHSTPSPPTRGQTQPHGWVGRGRSSTA